MPDAAALAIDLIRRSVSMRTPQLAEKLGIGEAAVDAMLEPARLRGELITCDVHAGGRRVLEYRCTVAGGKYTIHGGFVPLRDPSKVAPPRLELVDEINAGAAASSTGRADQAPPRPLPPLQHHQGETMEMTERFNAVHAAFKKHGPMKARALAKIVGFEVADVLQHGEDTQDFKRLGGKTSGTVWGLLGDKRPEFVGTDALERGAEIGRKKKLGKPRARKSSKRAGSQAAKKAWRTRRANGDKVRAANGRGFQVAITSEGRLLFLNAKRGDLDLTADELRGFVKALRHLNEDEVCHVLDFIVRLDGAQVAA